LVGRVNRRIDVGVVRFCRSTNDVLTCPSKLLQRAIDD
jgi:hypothetical protein